MTAKPMTGPRLVLKYRQNSTIGCGGASAARPILSTVSSDSAGTAVSFGGVMVISDAGCGD